MSGWQMNLVICSITVPWMAFSALNALKAMNCKEVTPNQYKRLVITSYIIMSLLVIILKLISPDNFLEWFGIVLNSLASLVLFTDVDELVSKKGDTVRELSANSDVANYPSYDNNINLNVD